MAADLGVASAETTAPASDTAIYAWFVVGALSLINMVSYIERQILTLLFTPIKRDFQLSDTEISLLAGAAFVLFFVVFGLYFGRLADSGNRKRIILIGTMFWSLATTMCGLAQSFVQLFVARISVGIGEASLSPSALSMISDYFPRKGLVRAISFYTGAQYVGAGMALVVGGLAIKLVDGLPPIALPWTGALRPWQLTFVFVGLGGLLFAVPLLFAREPARRGVARAPALPADPDRRARFGQFFAANRRTLLCHFMGFSLSTMFGFGVAAWVPTYFIRVHHWAAQDIGYAYGAITAIMGLAGALTGARIAEWLQGRGWTDVYFAMPMVTATINMVVFVSAMLLAPTAGATLTLLAASTFVGTLPLSLIMSSLQAVSPNQVRGQLVAVFGFIANVLGVASGPTVIALLTDYVYRDEQAVGLSLATASLIITPIVVCILGYGRQALRESLARADTFYAEMAA